MESRFGEYHDGKLLRSVELQCSSTNKNASNLKNWPSSKLQLSPQSKHIWKKYVPQCESSGMYLFYLDEGKTKLIVILGQTDHFEPIGTQIFMSPQIQKLFPAAGKQTKFLCKEPKLCSVHNNWKIFRKPKLAAYHRRSNKSNFKQEMVKLLNWYF